MKKLVLLFSISVFALQSNAQYIADCSKFCVTAVYQDTLNPGAVKIVVYNGDTSISHINYPYVSAVIASNGDTIGKGTVEFFAHMGGSSLTYTDSLVPATFPSNFVGTVILTYADMTGGDTSCVLSFPCAINGVKEITDKKLSLSPNPASESVWVDIPIGEKEVELLDATGRIIKSIRVKENETSININLNDVSEGTYLLRGGSGAREFLIILK